MPQFYIIFGTAGLLSLIIMFFYQCYKIGIDKNLSYLVKLLKSTYLAGLMIILSSLIYLVLSILPLGEACTHDVCSRAVELLTMLSEDRSVMYKNMAFGIFAMFVSKLATQYFKK